MIVADNVEVVSPVQAADAELIGRWEGSITAGPNTISLVVRVEQGPDGRRFALDSPAQGVRGLQVTDFSDASGVVRFGVPAAGGRFEGAISANGDIWTGTWSQGPNAAPLILTRSAAAVEAVGLARPQTPAPPYPYVAEDVTFLNSGAGITLAGTLTLPTGEGPFPAVVLLTGSGKQDRDETILDHKPFAVWADALTKRGIAVLRYDDRGVGGSGGGAFTETTADYADDTAAAIAYLQTRPEIDRARIGLMGHSEGGVTAPLAVSEGTPAAFVVMIAGPTVSGADIITEQVAIQAAAMGQSPEQVTRTRATQRAIMDAVVANKDDGTAATRAVRDLLIAEGVPADAAEARSLSVTSPWARWFASYDPAPALAALKVPLLAVYGDKDVQVPPNQSIPTLTRVRPDADVVVLPGLNHLMQNATTGLPAEYGTIEETIAPAALATVTDWIVRVTGAR